MSLLFIFDMDDVLYDFDWYRRMETLTAITGLPLEELRERWWNQGGEAAAEAGHYRSAEEYLEAFNQAIGHKLSEDQWIAARGGAMTPYPESIAAVERAAELGQVTLLTNNGPLTSKYLRALAPDLVPVFGDHLFTSSDYGSRKPNPEVFTAVLERYGVAPRDAFFADDLPENIAGAQSLGITSHLFTEPNGLLDAIEAFAAQHSSL
ncbi:MAG: HAD family phosphatase [Lacisediminihabitans sp.]